MGRSFQAYLLIVVLCFSVSANLAAVLVGSCGRACSTSCCGSPNCPMRRHGGKMPMKCPMHSKVGTDHGTMNCCCGVSQQDTSIVPASLFELRYDLPHAQGLLVPSFTTYHAMNSAAISSDGYGSLPDQPPRTSSIEF